MLGILRNFTDELALLAMTIDRYVNRLFNDEEQDMNGRVTMDFKLKGPTRHSGTQIALQMPKFKQCLHIFPKWTQKLDRIPFFSKALEPKNPFSSLPLLAAS